MIKRTPINKAVKLFNGDEEHDTYIIWNLMTQNNIDPQSGTNYAVLYRILCDEIDKMIENNPPGQKHFNSKDSKFISNIEVILNKIEELNDVLPIQLPTLGKQYNV